MSKRLRIRRSFAPTFGLSKSVWLVLAGLVSFLLGSALSFKAAIEPFLQWVRNETISLLSAVLPNQDHDVMAHMIGGALLLLGFVLLFQGARSALRQLMETLNPGFKSGMADIYLRKQQLARGPRIVALGGGTGLSTLLRGLKHHSSNITAIVTVTDDGGSSGRLVQEKGMIPPGDIRNCLVALADAEKSMTDLFQHRFKNDSGSLSGHSMGNLLIAALLDQSRGDFEKAVESASAVLAIRGRVVPSTLDHLRLRAILENGQELCGETKIVAAQQPIQSIFLDPEGSTAHPDALSAIRSADLICVGPGSVYTSLIPNLLVPGIAQAIAESEAVRVFVCNVMTQPGESDSFSASRHVDAVTSHCGNLKLFDYVVVNSGVPNEAAIAKYRESGQHLVEPDVDRIRAQGYKTVSGDLTSDSDLVRHDPLKVAARIFDLLRR